MGSVAVDRLSDWEKRMEERLLSRRRLDMQAVDELKQSVRKAVDEATAAALSTATERALATVGKPGSRVPAATTSDPVVIFIDAFDYQNALYGGNPVR
jgi:Iap family predicted aminopeptidase